LIEIGSKTAEKNSAQTNRQTDRHYENNGHLAVNQKYTTSKCILVGLCLDLAQELTASRRPSRRIWGAALCQRRAQKGAKGREDGN